MRLATRTTLAISLCALILFGGGGYLQLREEERDLRHVAQNEALLLGRSLQTAFENALRDRQIEDVAETLEALSHVDPSVAIFVYDELGALVGASQNAQPSSDTARIESQARGEPAPVIEFSPAHAPSVLRVGLRLRDEVPQTPSAIVLEKPLSEMQRDLAVTRRHIALVVLCFVLAVAGLAWFLTRRYVGLPLGHMVENMRRVRAGDLSIAPTARTADEVGDTQREFELLVADLEAARVRADQELEARQRMEHSLQQVDKLITMGQLSAVMAHEIGSPMQVLHGRARALLKHAEDPPSTRRTAKLLVEQIDRIARIVSQMLSITRRRAPVKTHIDAAASIRSVVALLELEARGRSIELRLSCESNSIVYADADQLQQVALNLCRNALEASPQGGVVTVHVGGDAESLVLRVSDDGPGIPDTLRPHLFEPFFTTKASMGGSGLGLSVVKAIVQEHGGFVEFEPTACGCSVRVVLPRSPSVSGSAAREQLRE